MQHFSSHLEKRLSQTIYISRFLAVSLIWWYHVGIEKKWTGSSWGESALTFFIVLSAFSAIKYSRLINGQVLDYFWHQFKKMVPLFLALNAALFLGSFIFPSRLGRPFTFLEWTLSSLGMSQYFGLRYLSMTFWFFPFIFQVYLLLPLLVKTYEKLERPLLWSIICWLISFVLGSLVFIFSNLQDPTEVTRNWSPLFRLGELSIGVALAKLPAQQWKKIFLFYFFASILWCVMGLNLFSDYWRFVFMRGGLILVFIIGLSWVCSGFLKKIKINILGESAFAFYLIHGAMILFVNQVFSLSLAIWGVHYFLNWIAAIIFTKLFFSKKINASCSCHE